MIRFIPIFLLLVSTLQAAAPKEQQASFQQMKFSIGSVEKEIRNHEIELSTLGQRLNNQEMTLELLREQLQEKKGDPGVSTMESKLTALVGDIQKMRTHANDLSDALNKTQTRLSEIESNMEAQGRNITNMQAALKSVLEAFDVKDTTTADGSYKVKNGDSLEKIARKYNTTIKRLKEINGLKNDRIVVGQSLRMPSS